MRKNASDDTVAGLAARLGDLLVEELKAARKDLSLALRYALTDAVVEQLKPFINRAALRSVKRARGEEE